MTVFFLKSTHPEGVVNAIEPLAWRHKLASMLEGYVTKGSLWDRLVFENARTAVFEDGAPSLKVVVVSGGGASTNHLTLAHIGLSLPRVIVHTHPLVSAPILAPRPYDVQMFAVTLGQEIAHVGPPTVNIKANPLGVDDGSVQEGDYPGGILHVCRPIVLRA
jgi:long-chain acyl-CoA synthetase